MNDRDARHAVAAALRQKGFEQDFSHPAHPRFRGRLDPTGLDIPVTIEVSDFDFVSAPVVRIEPGGIDASTVIPHVSGADDQLWTQNSSGILDTAESGDGFGAALGGSSTAGAGFSGQWLAVTQPGRSHQQGQGRHVLKGELLDNTGFSHREERVRPQRLVASTPIKVQAFLANLPLFRELQPTELDRIASGTREVHIGRGETLFRRGDPCEGLTTTADHRRRAYHSGAREVRDRRAPRRDAAKSRNARTFRGRSACPA